MFGEERVSNLEDFYMERWASDPLHYGLFSTWPVPANVPADTSQRLAAKVGRIFFANQASDANIGMTSGTIGASVRAMEQLTSCIRGEECQDYRPTMDARWDNKDDQLYDCVLIPKKPGKTRKVQANINNN